jgi:hypothetical protein
MWELRKAYQILVRKLEAKSHFEGLCILLSWEYMLPGMHEDIETYKVRTADSLLGGKKVCVLKWQKTSHCWVKVVHRTVHGSTIPVIVTCYFKSCFDLFIVVMTKDEEPG